jgi:endonuclease/exonuclease/phosphatase family metal-dependent hydrolase
MNRRVRAVILFVLAGLFPAAFGRRALAVDPCGDTPCVQVGTFNVEWFGTTDTSKHKHRSTLVVQQIADLIATQLDLEIVVLEEINSQSAEFDRLETALEAQGYKLASGVTGREQRVVIAYDDDEVDLVDEVRELDLRVSFNLSGGCRSSGLRRPLAATFRAGEFDFMLIGVHLKSQLGGDCADRVRREQCKDLIAKVDELVEASGEKDVIIAGDFNATFDDSSLNPLLQSTGFRALTRPSRRAKGSNSISYLEKPFQEIIDHLVVRLDDTPEWIVKSTFIFNPPSEATLLKRYLDFISDHAPAWASFDTAADDDD